MTVQISTSLKLSLVAGTGVTFSGPVVNAISTDDVYSATNPTLTLTQLLSALSTASLVGSATVNGTVTGDTALFTVPNGQTFIPTEIVFALTGITGSGEPPAVNVGFTANAYEDYLNSQENTTYAAATAAPFAAGNGYAIGDVLTFSGGTDPSPATQVTVTQALLASVSPNAFGTHYAPGDTITLAGGTALTNAVLTVSTVQLVSATVGSSGGTGYDSGSGDSTFNVTVAGGTHTSAATVNVTTNGSGVVTTINSVTPGSYTVLPTLTNNLATGDDGTHHGTGLELNLVFGVLTTAITIPGVYTTESTTFTQGSTSGSGTGATFNSATFGVQAVSVSRAGSYVTFPANHIAVTGGAGTSATFNATWTATNTLFASVDAVGDLANVSDFANTGNNYAYMTGGEQVVLNIPFASTYSAYTLMVFLFGFVYSG